MTTDNMWNLVYEAVGKALAERPHRNQVLAEDRTAIAHAAADSASAEWAASIAGRESKDEEPHEEDWASNPTVHATEIVLALVTLAMLAASAWLASRASL